MLILYIYVYLTYIYIYHKYVQLYITQSVWNIENNTDY